MLRAMRVRLISSSLAVVSLSVASLATAGPAPVLQLPRALQATGAELLAPTTLTRCQTSAMTVAVSFDSRYDDRACQSFVADASGTPAAAVAWFTVWNYQTTHPTIVAELFTDDGNGFPGTLLATSQPTSLTVTPFSATPGRFVFIAAPPVTAGVSYVLEFRPTAGLCQILAGPDETQCPGKSGRWAPLYYVGWGDLGFDIPCGLAAR